MTQTNFDNMSREDLRAYMLGHKDDEAAFHAYMDRLAGEPVLAHGSVEDLQDPDRFAETIQRVQRLKREIRNQEK